MPFLKKHAWVCLSLTFLWFYQLLPELLLENGFYRFFYFTTMICSLAFVWAIVYLGEGLRQGMVRLGWSKSLFSGANWNISSLLGIGVLGNIAILCTVFSISSPLFYKGLFSLLVLSATFFVSPATLLRPFQRLLHSYHKQKEWKWLWWIPLFIFGVKFFSTVFPINGTEQLHNTLPFGKYVFRGVDFNTYNLDNHFLLLGIYETFGVFIRGFTWNDFAHHSIGQQVTFLLTVGGGALLLGTVPWVLKRLPWFALCLMAWPMMLNFAPTDAVAFKPDWIGILSAGIATFALVRQWVANGETNKNKYMVMVVLFSALATTTKLTALPYVIFLLILTVVLSVLQQRRIQVIHLMMPVLYLSVCSIFLGKNFLWLGNPLYPGLQAYFPKPELLSDTTTFNTFQINKVTKIVPGFFDYIWGYLRFWEHHPEFIVPVLLTFAVYRKALTKKIILSLAIGFVAYITLMSFNFYPDIYQRYVAFAYILLLMGTIALFIEGQRQFRKKALLIAIGCFTFLMFSHSYVDANARKAVIEWWRGISPKEYRIEQDPIDLLYFEINERCQDFGRLHNFKWRNYFYADFDTINAEDLMGLKALYDATFYNRYNVNFVITPESGGQYDYMTKISDSWFLGNFSIVYQTHGLLLWQRNNTQFCQKPFVLK